MGLCKLLLYYIIPCLRHLFLHFNMALPCLHHLYILLGSELPTDGNIVFLQFTFLDLDVVWGITKFGELVNVSVIHYCYCL